MGDGDCREFHGELAMKNAWRIVTMLGIAGLCGCVSQRSGAPGPVEATASLPSPEEVRAKEEAEARGRRAAFVTGELNWILENATPHADARVSTAPR